MSLLSSLRQCTENPLQVVVLLIDDMSKNEMASYVIKDVCIYGVIGLYNTDPDRISEPLVGQVINYETDEKPVYWTLYDTKTTVVTLDSLTGIE
jgi:hypothetical protein